MSEAAIGPRGGTRREDPDSSLARRAADGDRSAFAELISRHYDSTHRIAWRISGSFHDAQDTVQDVWCNLPAKIGRFRGECLFSTWLAGIVRNACIDAARRRGTQAAMRARLSIVTDDGTLAPADPHARIWIESALSRLTPDLRETVVLVAGEGMSHKEAAIALGCAEPTVSWRMQEARRRLREQGLEEAVDG